MTATAVGAPTSTAPIPTTQRKGLNWPFIGNIAAIVLIMIWCLAPFYWMFVMSPCSCLKTQCCEATSVG
jgi:multiple sugar transport system permease protein